MAAAPRQVIVRSGGSGAAGVLLLLLAIAGLVALFSGNLDRVIDAIAGGAGGAAGLTSSGAGGVPFADPAVQDRSPQPAGGGGSARTF